MSFKKITIAGGGVLGSQIAFQTAYSGFDVVIYSLPGEEKEIKNKLNTLKKTYLNEIKVMSKSKDFKTWSRGIAGKDTFNEKKCTEKVNNAIKKIKITDDLEKAVKDADLVVEAVIENVDLKREFYKKMAPFLKESTVIVTNSSTILPSKLAKSTGRANKFLSMHFANAIWKNNISEIMMHPKTEKKYFKQIIKFAEEINMIPLPVLKEKSGYLLNSMLVPFLFAGLDLYVNGISDPESIDKAWKLGTGAPNGPFEILDVVGLKTAYNIVLMYVKVPSIIAPYNFKGMEKLLKQYIDKGKIGKSVGEGFYKYK